MIIKDLNRCQTGNSIIVKYWKMFCSCSYPGRGPGPGPGQQQSVHRLRPHKRRRRRRAHQHVLDSNSYLFWLYWLGITWLSSSMTIVGCKNDGLLVSNCDFNKLERIADANSARLNEINRQPNCTYTKQNYYEYTQNDDTMRRASSKRDEEQSKTINEIRLTAIKHQILTKLGLKSKPNVTHTLSKEMILETLRRTGEAQLYNYHQNPQDIYVLSGDHSNTVTNYKITNQFYQNQQFNLYNNNQNQQQQQQEQVPFEMAYNDDENNVADDFYGKTREIIAFASKGKYLMQI